MRDPRELVSTSQCLENLRCCLLYSQNSNGRRIHTNAYPIALHSLRFNSARTIHLKAIFVQ